MSGQSPPPTGEGRADQPQNVATTIAEVSERATLLVREEIELAKAEVAEKAASLARGAVVGVAAGIFIVMALVFALVGCAWLLYYYLPGSDFTYFWGFFAMAVILLGLGAGAGLLAARVVRKSAPPVPDMAIEEARRIRETVAAGTDTATHQMAARTNTATQPVADGTDTATQPVAPGTDTPPQPEARN